MLAALLALCRRFEGKRPKPYLCPAGVPTQGYGHTGPDVKLGGPAWSDARCEAVLEADAGIFERAAAQLSPNLADIPDAHAAIADFCFNLGTTRYKASTLRRRVREGRWSEVPLELRKWVWGGGRRLPGLVLRREAEALLVGAPRARPAPAVDRAPIEAAPSLPAAPIPYAELRR